MRVSFHLCDQRRLISASLMRRPAHCKLLFVALLLASLQICAALQLVLQTNSNSSTKRNENSNGPLAAPQAEPPKTADLSRLINETLAINKKSPNKLGAQQKDEQWSFERVEYDLMEFLQDLSARYKQQANETNFSEQSSEEALLEGKFDANKTTSSPEQVAGSTQTSGTQSSFARESLKPTQAPQLSTSLASGEPEIAESSWQYGIFDRFTRPKTTSTTTTREPQFEAKPDARFFNNDECGLRFYEDLQPQFAQENLAAFEVDNQAQEASKELNQRRQRPSALLASTLGQKKQQLDAMALNEKNDQLNQDELEQVEPVEQPAGSGGNENSAVESDFNLASRRHWLQQQLESTLQLLGFNASAQSAAEFLNQTSGLSLNTRENMMRKSSKLGKSSDQLNARQDELKLEARVIGGSDARLGDSPWSVSLQALVSKPGTIGVEYRHYCGGTIISDYYVLTAAHCLDFMVGRESRLFVVIGDLNWRMSAASLYGRRFGIEKLIIHSGYKSTAFGHDIGLIKTKESMRPLKVNGRYIVNHVCLPDRNVEHSGEAELVGWGLFSNRNEMADTLQVADVPILPRPLCVDLYKRRTGLIQWLIGIELITDKQVCAGTFGRGICQGDSGSALVVNDKVRNNNFHSPYNNNNNNNNNFVANSNLKKTGKRLSEREQTKATIIGIVAFGGIRRCSYQSLPGVYMQTSKYMDWILPRIQPTSG